MKSRRLRNMRLIECKGKRHRQRNRKRKRLRLLEYYNLEENNIDEEEQNNVREYQNIII